MKVYSRVTAGLLLLAFWASPSAFADRVAIFLTDESRFQAQLDAAGATKQTLDVAYPFVHDDVVTHAFLNRLILAAKRGVAVRLLLDPIGNELSKKEVAYLMSEGVEVRFFHDLSFTQTLRSGRLSWLWKRMHDKLVLSDGETLITGSENMGAPYYNTLPRERPAQRFYGRNLKVDGEAARTAKGYFDQLWVSDDVSTPRGIQELDDTNRAEIRRLFENAERTLDLNPGAPAQAEVDLELSPDAISFLSNSDGAGPSGDLNKKIIGMIRGAKSELIIETPYVLPPKEIEDLLIAKAHEKVHVVILTNSALTNNHPSGNPLYLRAIDRLRKNGVEVLEWAGSETMHGKAVISDGEEVLLTTANLNLRSWLLDSESGIYVRSGDLAGAIKTKLNLSGFSSGDRARSCVLNALGILLYPARGQF